MTVSHTDTVSTVARTVVRYRLDASRSGRGGTVALGAALLVLIPLATLVISIDFLAGMVANTVWLRLAAARGSGKAPSATLSPELCWLGIALSVVAQFLLQFFWVGAGLAGGFVAGVVASRLWLTLRRHESRAHLPPLPTRRRALYWAGVGLMGSGVALFAIFVLPYWLVGRNLAGEIGAPPGYSGTDIDVRNPLSLAFEYERFLAINGYVRDRPATEAEITQEITAWLADRGFDQPGTIGELQVLGRARSDQYDADLASFGMGRADSGVWADGRHIAEDRTYDFLSVSLDVADQDGLVLGGPVFLMLLAGSVLTLASFVQKARRVGPAPPAPPGIITTERRSA